jgi:hypothetical protein
MTQSLARPRLDRPCELHDGARRPAVCPPPPDPLVVGNERCVLQGRFETLGSDRLGPDLLIGLHVDVGRASVSVANPAEARPRAAVLRGREWFDLIECASESVAVDFEFVAALEVGSDRSLVPK